MYSRAANRYRNVSLHSASPQQMLTEVFHRLIADIDAAKACIESGNIVGKSKAIGHAIELIGALISSLDFDAAPDLCHSLARLYDFASERLLTASAKLDVAPLAEALQVLENLRDAFAEAAARP